MSTNTNNTNNSNVSKPQVGLLCEVAIGEELASMQLEECTMPNNNKGKGK